MDIRNYTVPDSLGRDTRECVVPRMQAILDNITKRGIFYIARRDCVTGYDADEFYDWDLYFECLFLSHFGVSQFCRSNTEMFLDLQYANGFVPRTVREPRQSPNPVFLPRPSGRGSFSLPKNRIWSCQRSENVI